MKNFLKTKAEIEDWLDEHSITNYSLIPDENYGFVVDVFDSVNLVSQNLTHIPVKFNHVMYSFDCSENQLTHLDFCPQFIKLDFRCRDNQLTSLVGCTQNVGGSFYCSKNKITTLLGCPQYVYSNFNCSANRLSSLEFCPVSVGNILSCENNQIESLLYCPKMVGGEFYCEGNPLLSNAQQIIHFKEIYQIHQNLVSINAEKELIKNSMCQLEHPLSAKTVNTHKI